MVQEVDKRPSIRLAKKYLCTSDEISCNNGMCSCTCEDKKPCMWTKDKVLMGCPCEDTPKVNFKFN